MMKSDWINHKGKHILYINCSDYGDDLSGLAAEIDHCRELITQCPEKSVLGLTNVLGTTLSSEALHLFKNTGSLVNKYCYKQAIVGVYGIRIVLYQAVARVTGVDAKLFDDIEQAKDWLVRPD
jgi:hypothetical protein